MKHLSLANSDQVALVSDEDFLYCSLGTWWLCGSYAKSSSVLFDKDYLHVVIAKRMKLDFIQIDHADRNKLNCQRDNLRSATCSDNGANTERPSTSSGYRGVTWNYLSNKWKVIVVKNKKKYFFGHYVDVKEAALAYNKGAKLLHGQFAILNEVQDAI